MNFYLEERIGTPGRFKKIEHFTPNRKLALGGTIYVSEVGKGETGTQIPTKLKDQHLNYLWNFYVKDHECVLDNGMVYNERVAKLMADKFFKSQRERILWNN